MELPIAISSDFFSDVLIRNIIAIDQENLRNWKNENRFSFFYKGVISPSAQKKWFDEYLTRADDYLFIVHVQNYDIGCMGIRLLHDEWDIYNVIIGNDHFSGKGYMTKALTMMCSFALETNHKAIKAKVLKSNPALNWYKKNCFTVKLHNEEYVEIELNLKLFKPCPIKRTL